MKDEKTKKDEYEKALAAFGDAVKEFRKSKWDKAVELFKDFIQKYDFERDLAARARTYLAIAEERSREPREIPSPKTVEDFIHAAVYKLNVGAVEDAAKFIEKALKTDPEDARVLFLQANILCRNGQADAALEALKKAVQNDKSYRILAQNDVDFAPLWEDKRFRAITRND